MFDHEKLVETEATAGKEMLRRISAMVAGF